jgi:hypothetical protein
MHGDEQYDIYKSEHEDVTPEEFIWVLFCLSCGKQYPNDKAPRCLTERGLCTDCDK